MAPFLPKNDPNPAKRQNKLSKKQGQYQYDYEYIAPLPMLKKLSFEDYPSVRWLSLVAEAALKLLLNSIQVKNLKEGKDTLNNFETYLTMRKRLKSNEFGAGGFHLMGLFGFWWMGKSRTLKETLKMLISERINSSGDGFDEYEALFQAIRLPETSNRFQEDSEFARMRVAGSNPLVIERVTALDQRFPVTEAHYQLVMPGDSLRKAGEEGRLYLADYAILAGVKTGKVAPSEMIAEKQKYLCAPLALFAVPPATSKSRALLPIAIQCGQNPEETPIISPPSQNDSDSAKWAWLIAKTIVQIADANHHELISHLGLTHLLIEPFAIATKRQLASAHPLNILLRPHFEGTLLINDLAQKRLTGKGQPVDEVLAGTYLSSQGLSATAIQSFIFNDSMLPDTFVRRGVNDPDLLPEYPYRDDALMIWAAIHQWVSDYLSIYYESDDDVFNDTELQNWLNELLSSNGGRLNGIGQEGKIRSLSYLVDATTQIIFTASAQHAAVNYPQAPLMSYAPAMPMAGYTPDPKKIDDISQQDYFDLLPPIKQAQVQLNLTYLLGSVYYTKLGDYTNLTDARVQKPLQDFQKKLEEIESKIILRNLTHPEKSYKFLMPSKIPQSINI
jgi:arachidonate 15-lipoxygenase